MNKSNIALIIALIALLLSLSVQFLQPPTQPTSATDKKESTYDRVMRTGEIRCGYTPYSVGLNVDQEGNFYGIYKELMDEVGALLDLKVVYTEEVGWGEQITGLNAGRYDMVCSPANMTASRVRGADFVQPLYYSPVYAWAKQTNNKFVGSDKENMQRANAADVVVASIDGEQAEAQAKLFFPNAKLFSAPQSAAFTSMYLNVATGKADLAIAEPASVLEFLEHNPEPNLVPINPESPLIMAINIMMVENKQIDFRNLMNDAISVLIANGTLDTIIDQWEPYPNSYIRVARTK